VLTCLFFFLLNKLFSTSALVLPAKQVVPKSPFQEIPHQSPYHIYILFLVCVSISKYLFPQHGQPELQTQIQNLLPGHLMLLYLLLLNYLDVMKPRREKKRTILGAILNMTSCVLKIVVLYSILCTYEAQKGLPSEWFVKNHFLRKLMKTNFKR